MALNGLDDLAVQAAFEGALNAVTGWFLLKYSSRDEVVLHASGTAGHTELRKSIESYKDASILYGFLKYRDNKILLKYQPEDCSRLVQARAMVHFNMICDRFPYDHIYDIITVEQIKEQKLAGLCDIDLDDITPLPSPRCHRLDEIAEEGEDIEELSTTRRKSTHNSRPSTATMELPVTLNSDLAKSLEAAKISTATALSKSTGMDERPESSAESMDFAGRLSSQSTRTFDTSYPSYKSKVMLNARPAEAPGRPGSSNSAISRPISSLPAGFKASKAKKEKKHKDRDDDESINEVPEIAVEGLSLVSEESKIRPHTSSGSSAIGIPSSMIPPPPSPTASLPPAKERIAPEKARLMKAMKLREKKKNQAANMAVKVAAAKAEANADGNGDIEMEAEVEVEEDVATSTEVLVQEESRPTINHTDSGIVVENSDDTLEAHSSSPSTVEVSEPISTKASSISDNTEGTVQEGVTTKKGLLEAAVIQPTLSVSAPAETKVEEKPVKKPTEKPREEFEVAVVAKTSEEKIPEVGRPTPVIAEEHVVVKSAPTPVVEAPLVIKAPISTLAPEVPPVVLESVVSSPAPVIQETLPETLAPSDVIPPVETPVFAPVVTEEIKEIAAKEALAAVEAPANEAEAQVQEVEVPTTVLIPDSVTVSPTTIAPMAQPVTDIKVEAVEKNIVEKEVPVTETLAPAAATIPEVIVKAETPAEPERLAADSFSMPPPSHPETKAEEDGSRSLRRRPAEPIRVGLTEDTVQEKTEAGAAAGIQSSRTSVNMEHTPVTPLFPAPYLRSSSPSRPYSSSSTRTFSQPTVRSSIVGLPSDVTASSARSVSSGAGAAYLHKITQQSFNNLAPKNGGKIGSKISQRIKALEQLSSTTGNSAPPPPRPTSSTFYSVRKSTVGSDLSRSPSAAERGNALGRSDSRHSCKSVVLGSTNRDRSSSVASRMSRFEMDRPDSVHVTTRIVSDSQEEDFPEASVHVHTGDESLAIAVEEDPRADPSPPEQNATDGPRHIVTLQHRRMSTLNPDSSRASSPARTSFHERRISRDLARRTEEDAEVSLPLTFQKTIPEKPIAIVVEKINVADEALLTTPKTQRPRRRSSLTVVKDFIRDRRRSVTSSNNASQSPRQPSTYNLNSFTGTPSSSGSGVSYMRRLSIGSRRSSISKEKDESKSPTESGDEERKMGKAGRFMQRLSSGFSVRPGAKSPIAVAPTVQEETIAAMGTAAVKARPKLKPTGEPEVTVMGDVNVQFPDNLLWKRRTMGLDNLGFLILTPVAVAGGRGDKLSGAGLKRFHLSDFRKPYVPDVDMQELPNSICLEFVEGSSLQIACGDRSGQVTVLSALDSAWAVHGDN